MEEYKRTYGVWRSVLMKSLIWLGAAIFLTEAGVFLFRLYFPGMEKPGKGYLLQYAAVPTLLSLANIGIGYLAIQADGLTERGKNYVPEVCLLMDCFLVSVIHEYFYITAVLFVFPVFISVVYADRRLTRDIAAASAVMFGLSAAWFTLRSGGAVGYRLLNELIGLCLLAGACWSSRIMLSCMEEREKELEEGVAARCLLEQRLRRDQMTGLYNHTEFYKELERAVREDRQGGRLAVAIVDIDNFKLVNDNYGHERGNTVLIGLAGLLQEECSENGHVSRYGGEEFAVIFRELDLEEIRGIMERFREELQHRRFDRQICITASIGIAVHEEGMTAGELFERADAAMYTAKHQGRNRIVVIPYGTEGI